MNLPTNLPNRSTSEQKQILNFLLHSTAAKLLSSSPQKSKIQQESRSVYNQIRARYSAEDVKGVDLIANILLSLTAQLVRCTDVDQLASVVSYIEAVEKGEVLIAEAIQAPEVPAVDVVPIAEPEPESKPVPKKRAAKPKVPKVKPAKIVEQVEEVPTPTIPQVAPDYIHPGSGTIPKW